MLSRTENIQYLMYGYYGNDLGGTHGKRSIHSLNRNDEPAGKTGCYYE